jgi:hypothetical protein
MVDRKSFAIAAWGTCVALCTLVLASNAGALGSGAHLRLPRPPRPAFAGSAKRPSRLAQAAGILNVSDTGRLRFTGESGSQLVEEGPATGTLPGSVRAQLTVGTTVTVSFTIYLRNGTLTGHGTAQLNPGKGTYASFSGSLRVSHGSGHYAHAAGSGGLYGTIDRNNDNATVQVVGRLHL